MQPLRKLKFWVVVGAKYIVTGRTGMDDEDVERKLNEISHILSTTSQNLLVGRRDTNCPQLWDTAFIDQFGNVFNCCYSRPMALGNVNKSQLSTIWRQSLRLKLARWLSRHRALFCSLSCDLITDEGKREPPKARTDSTHPTVIRILSGELCNLSCIMCWQNHTDRQMISNDVLKARIDWPRVEHVELQGGEILAMKQAKELFLWLTQEMGKKVDLITNGTLVDETWARNLVLGANWVAVSVNAASRETHERVNRGSRFEKVARNIQRMTRLKRELGAELVVIYKFSIIPENIHEVADAIPVAAELGCDKISYGFDPASVPPLLAGNPELREGLRERLKAEINAGHAIEVETLRLERLGLLDETQV